LSRTNNQKWCEAMFEQTLEEMKARVCVEPAIFQTLTADNVGVSAEIIFSGEKDYSYSEAMLVVTVLDKVLKNCPKYLQKRIRAQRMSFVFAFGPDMEEICGHAPALR
jgi:hypothetical protein